MRPVALVLAVVVAVAGCTPGAPGTDTTDDALAGQPGQLALDAAARPAPPVVEGPPSVVPSSFPPGPVDVPTGPLPTEVQVELDEIVATFATFVDLETIRRLRTTDDPRVLWPLAELLRFTQSREEAPLILDVVEATTGVVIEPGPGSWTRLTDHLLAWDLPAPPGYVAFKAGLLTQLEPGWAPLFADPDAAVDWREFSWGGVRLDDRPFGSTERCDGSCIPALDDPLVTDADGGSWYADDGTVFAVVVNGEARAYPLHMMQVHELVNDEVGGVRIGIPYCTLCGSAQAYVTGGVEGLEDVDGPVVLRTSGLLHLSNKVVVDLAATSMIDTFSGEAISGPLRAAGVRLEPVTTLTTTWGAWKAEHPDTTILAQDPGTGRTYLLDPLAGRDADGPIFPIGDVDPRLPLQALVVGVVASDGSAIAFDAADARTTLERGGVVAVGDVQVTVDGGGLRVIERRGPDVAELPTHESFWFAWSQRHPTTSLWTTTQG